MKKHGGSVRWFLLVCLIIPAIFAACGGAGGGSGSETPGIEDDGGTPPPEPAGPTSDELIDAAVDTGAIDYETGLLYKIYATFNDDRLPAEYAGDDEGLIHGEGLDIALAEFDTLSPETQAAIEPFLAPPYYEGSWWDRARTADLSAGAQPAAIPCNPIHQGCSLLADWLYVEGTHVKVWYLAENTAEDILKAQAVLDAVESLTWDTLTGLMGQTPVSDGGGFLSGGDGRYDIALVDYGKLGSTIASSCKNSSAFTLLKRTLDIQDIRATAVHEFMHAIQFAFDLQQNCLKDYLTLSESTANWSVDYIFNQSNQWEHQHPSHYLNEPEKSWDDTSKKIRPYGAYLFPFYLGNIHGAQTIAALWQAAAKNTQLGAVNAAVDLETAWPEFAWMNWNREPYDMYSDWDDLTANVPAPSPIHMGLGGAKEIEAAPFALDLPHLSAKYYHLVFDDPAVRTFAFFNGFSWKLGKEEVPDYGRAFVTQELPADQKKGAHVQALIKRNGAWEAVPSDLTGHGMVSFCQDRAEERVEEIVLIFSNSDIDTGRRIKPQGDKPAVLISNMGCGDWEGNIHLTQNAGGTTETYSVSGVTWEVQGHIGFPAANGGTAWIGTSYQATGGSMTWSISGTNGSCTYSGGPDSAPLPPFPLNTGTFHNLRFIRSGTGYRSFYLIGVSPLPPKEWPYTETCEDGTYQDTSVAIDFLLSVEPGGPHATVDESGGYIWGDGSDTHDETIEGTWSFQAVSDP